jgi:hypothetical protein
VGRGLQAGVRINPVLGTVAIVTGAGLVLLTLFDLALTTLHVQSESLFSTRINRAVWSALSRASGLAPEPLRDEMLGWALPLMLGATMAAWALAVLEAAAGLLTISLAVTYLRYGLDPDSYPDVARDPRVLMLEEGNS